MAEELNIDCAWEIVTIIGDQILVAMVIGDQILFGLFRKIN